MYEFYRDTILTCYGHDISIHCSTNSSMPEFHETVTHLLQLVNKCIWFIGSVVHHGQWPKIMNFPFSSS